MKNREPRHMNAKPPPSGHPIPSREDFCAFCRLIYDRHLVTGVGGNVSVRAGREIYLTPTGYSLRDLQPDQVSVLTPEGALREGPPATKDAPLHLAILRTRNDVHAVLHVHGAHIVAASMLLEPGPDSLPPLTPGFVYYAHPLPLLPFLVPGGQGLVRAVSEHIGKDRRSAVLLQNHGLVTVGRTMEEALDTAEEIEEAARIFLLTGGKGTRLAPEAVKAVKGLRPVS